MVTDILRVGKHEGEVVMTVPTGSDGQVLDDGGPTGDGAVATATDVIRYLYGVSHPFVLIQEEPLATATDWPEPRQQLGCVAPDIVDA
jgi:hypothetical protein